MASGFSFSIFLIFLVETTVFVLFFLTFLGGACSETIFFSFSLTFSIIFFALGRMEYLFFQLFELILLKQSEEDQLVFLLEKEDSSLLKLLQIHVKQKIK